MDWEPLINAATEVRERAYAPYSRFLVGAALLAEDGRTFTGCNVENSSYGLTVCAERVALQTAVAAGCRRFIAAVVVTDTRPASPPCGPCLSVLAEFTGPELQILLINPQGERKLLRLGELLPVPFSLPASGAES